jgi:hypothetical protein
VFNPDNLKFLADPFLIVDSPGVYIFVEQVIGSNGDIGCFYSRSTNLEKLEYKGIVLNESFHLSYPQVFKYNDKFFMLPESQNGGNVYLYETDSFPYNWVKKRILINKNNVKDPTILIEKDSVYIFGTQDDHLYSWSASSLSDTFIKNPKPLLMGTESRPGGRIFRYDGKLIIPIQNNSKGYGTGLSLYEVKKDKVSFKLSRFQKFFFSPQKNFPRFSHGMHHLDFQEIEDGYIAVYDGNNNLDGTSEFSLKSYLKFLYLNLKNMFVNL